MKNNDIRQFMRKAAAVKPSARQLDWFDKAFYAFIHFGINTLNGEKATNRKRYSPHVNWTVSNG